MGPPTSGGHAVDRTHRVLAPCEARHGRPSFIACPAPPAPLAVGFDLDMTLIDTVPGFAAGAGGARRGARGRVPGRGDDRHGSARRWRRCSRRTSPPTRRPGGRPVPRALPRPRHRVGAASCPARTRRWPPYAATAAGSSWSPASTPPTPSRHLDHLGLDVDVLEGWVWGVGKAEVLRREGVSVYVGDHVHDVEGALAAGALSVSVLTGGCTREELRGGRHPRGARLARRTSRPGSTSTCSSARLAALEADLRARGLGAGRLQRRRRQRLPARRRGAGARRRPGRRGDRLLRTRCPRSSATRPGAFAESLGVEVLTPETHEMEREGYRANGGDRCFFCKAELRRRAHPARARARAGRGRHRHQRRRRGRRLPPGHPGRRRARRGRPAARRRADQGAGPRGLAPLGAADLGQAGRRLPVLAGRVRRRGDAAPAGPRRAGRGRRTRALLAAVGAPRPAGPRPRRPRLGRGRRGAAAAAGRARRAVVAAVRAQASTRPTSTRGASAPAR